MTIQPYLRFNGNCREAMTFYKECLGGTLTFQTIGESPFSFKMPAKMKEVILHAMLAKGEMVLLGSDMVGKEGLVKGNTVAFSLQCGSEEELKNCYRLLSTGGEITHAPEENFWGALSGDLTDKYGNYWLLYYNKNPQ